MTIIDAPDARLREEAGETRTRRVLDPAASGVAFIEGTFVPLSEAKISVLDFGFTRSDVTYDVVHVWNGRFFRLDAHSRRYRLMSV